MPSFLNKVFGYRKSDDKETAREHSSALLDGKYEAVPLPRDPRPAKDPEHDAAFSLSLFKPRSSGVSQKRTVAAPHLTLQLPGPKDGEDARALGVVFEANPDSQIVLDDALIAAKRLNPLEALILVRACAQAITERGLETPGVMHPHWLSASPDVQRRLISLFIRSLTPQSRVTTLFPTPASSASAFENELHYTRSPHDVAAVLRWGIRHLSLENGRFGKDGEWAWYDAFFHAERDASYPPKAFSELLLPRLPASHVELLTATLSLVSSLASHAESNSISGSKLAKFWGIWLLLATRAEQSDDWGQFYARWERAGRILEHLFLARLREESLGQRLPTRLQELVKHYPYHKGSSAAEDELLSRPRFSTRQHDALFVRVETLLTHNSEQPKQHPIQLLLDAFELPIENPSGDEHVALWNTLKTTASEEVTSSDPEGLRFTRIFVDETIQLLSLIPADNNVPTSPTLLATPLTKIVSRQRSSSLIKALERIAPRSTKNNGSTSASPASPSSAVITDWAQFSLSGFSDTPTTQPLAALLYQDDDTEVTQPRFSRKSSRGGKSRARRPRSEEPPDTPPSSHFKLESSIIETKLASVHVIQIDEAFIDFWSDAVVDPISANWPTFVVCGLKQTPGAERAIHWLVIEQAYGRQQLQPSRVPSPDGLRGRSPRPSFRSDISGFRINSVFSSARKRFSAFSKSATDLTAKRSGGKTPVTGELGEILVEEEPSPSNPTTKGDHHGDGNTIVGTAVTGGATTNVADQLVDEIFTVPIAGIPPADLASLPKDESDPASATAKAFSAEPKPTPQPEGKDSVFSVPSRSPVRTSEEAISVEQGSRTLDVVNSNVNGADPVGKIVPLAAATFDLWSGTPDAGDRTVLASGPAPLTERSVIEEMQAHAERFRQDSVVKVTDCLVELDAPPAGGDFTGELSNVDRVDIADNGSRELAEAVAVPPASEDVVGVLATLDGVVDDEAPEHNPGELHAVEQPSQKAPTEFSAAITVSSSVGQQVMDDLLLASASDAQDEVIATETGAQLEPDVNASAVEEAMEVAELVETPAPEESVALVEETPGPEFSVDACALTATAQDSAATRDALDDVAPRFVAAEQEATLETDEASVALRVEEPSVEIVLAVDTSAPVVAVESERAADQVLELATEEEVQPPVQDAIVQVAERPSVETPPVPEVEVHVSAAGAIALAEAVAQAAPNSVVSEAHIVETHGTPTPAPENAAVVDETLGTDIAAEVHEVVVVVALELEVVEDKVPDPSVEAKTPPTDSIPLDEEVQPSVETEPPTQFADTHPAEALSTESITEGATVASTTADEVITFTAEAQPTLHVPTEGAKVHTPAPESASTEDTPKAVIEANEPAQLALGTAADPEPNADKAAEPVMEEAQVLGEATVLFAREPTAVTPTAILESLAAQVTIENETPSSSLASQSTDDAANAPIAGVSVLDISAVDGEAPPEPIALRVTVDAVDAELAPPVPEVGVSIEETLIVVDADAPGTLATEPELVEISASTTPAVEEARAPVGSSASQSTDEAADAPIAGVLVLDIGAVDVEAPLEPDAEPTPPAPEVGVSIEETLIIVGADESGTLATEPELFEVSPPAPVFVGSSASQSTDVAANAPIAGVFVLDIGAVDVEAPLEPDAEPTPPAPEVGVSIEETLIIVDAGESGTLATEPELVEVSPPAPAVEVALVEAGEPSPVAAEVTAPSQLQAAAPVVELDETSGASGPQEVIDPVEHPVR